MTHAIALAATSIGGLHVSANTSVARQYHAGLSAMLGVQAAMAAQKGYQAEPNVMEMQRGFFSAYGGAHLEEVTLDLGASWDIVTNMAIKLVPGGHPHHAAAEAAANAAIEGMSIRRMLGASFFGAEYRALHGPSIRPISSVLHIVRRISLRPPLPTEASADACDAREDQRSP